MHLIRRQAIRAISSPSPSFARSINTSTPFSLRSKTQKSAFSPAAFRRFASDDASKNTPSSADVDDQSSIRSAVESAAESASTYASDAAESFTDSAVDLKDRAVEVGEGAAAAVGRPFREDRRERRPERDSYGGRGNDSRGGYGGRDGGDRSGGNNRMERGEPRPPPADLQPSNGIYVGNLLFDVTAADLEQEFASYGTITKTTVASDARGLSKGFGYVEFENLEQAKAAIEGRDQTVYQGRRLVVNYMAKTKRVTSQTNEPSRTLFIGNLAFEMSDADLNKLFRDIQNVIDVRVAIDRRTGQPRGFAHADFVDVESAVKGMSLLQGKEIYGRVLRIDYSGTPSRRENGGGDRGGDRRGEYAPREQRY